MKIYKIYAYDKNKKLIKYFYGRGKSQKEIKGSLKGYARKYIFPKMAQSKFNEITFKITKS